MTLFIKAQIIDCNYQAILERFRVFIGNSESRKNTIFPDAGLIKKNP